MLLLSVHILAHAPDKLVVGQTTKIMVSDKFNTAQYYLARIDTGAKISSIHAIDIHIEGAVAAEKDNIGKAMTFTALNEKGELQVFKAMIKNVTRIRNAQGIENRYVIEINLIWRGFDKTILVNLRDRSKMNYQLLLGRNWLHNNIIVDVDLHEGIVEK